MMMIMIMINMR